jgi:glycosyltransferase involved in cell wall biosynthesis
MKVVLISSMLPSGHYSQYLAGGLNSLPNIQLIIYADKNPENLNIYGYGHIKNIWSKNVGYISQIIREIGKDKPDIVHVQHEVNMYGGLATAALFPLLLLMLKVKRCRVVTTIHASVYMKQINAEFMSLFHRDSTFFGPTLLKAFFFYLFKAISILSDGVIVHTQLAKKILVADYSMNAAGISVIPIAIPVRNIRYTNRESYFLYFGYMVRRKGLDFALEGFKRYLEKNLGSSFKLVLVGGVISGQEEALNEIKSMIHVHGLEKNVIIRGFVEEDELDQLFCEAEAVIIPAKVSMGSSGPLFHAASYGKCVVASKLGHFMEDIEHCKTGILIENDRWQEAFQFVVDNPEIVVQVEYLVSQKASTRTPYLIAGAHEAVYKLVTD